MGAEAQLITFLTFLTFAVFVAYIAFRLRVPYTIAMVLAGLGVSILNLSLGYLNVLRLEPTVILLIFLPGLLFEAGYHLDLRQLRNNLGPILLLAIPGVILSAFIIGYLVTLILGLSLSVALLFGVLISATDPTAVVALFKELGIDRRLEIIMEGESLFNDGVAIVLYSILVGIASGSSTFNLTGSLLKFFVVIAGGVALGTITGFLFAELMKRTDEPIINIALTTILAYGTYLLADQVLRSGVSPVIAVVTGAIVLGNYRTKGRHPATSTTMIITFWDFFVFLINSAIFLMLGLEMDLTVLFDNFLPIALTILIILFARTIVVYLFRFLINTRPPGLPFKWAHVISWGGLRGAVSVALALSLPTSIEARGLLILITFGYVLFSVVVQGLTLRPFLKRLRLTSHTEKETEFERLLAQMSTAQASVTALRELYNEHLISKPLADRLQKRYEDWMQKHQVHINQMISEKPQLAETNIKLVQREIADTQKQTLRLLLQRGIISEEVYDEFNGRIDERMQKQANGDLSISADLMEDLEDFLPSDLSTHE